VERDLKKKAVATPDLSRPAAGAVDRLRHRTVIVIDDEVSVRTYVCAVVRKMGLTGIEASSATDVKRIAAEHKDAILVLDLSLGRNDAGEVLAALATEHFTGPIILISGHERTLLDWVRGIGDSMRLNMASTLRKPFTPDALRDSIRIACEAAQ
jgi:DNA-binding NtrC family response regulator